MSSRLKTLFVCVAVAVVFISLLAASVVKIEMKRTYINMQILMVKPPPPVMIELLPTCFSVTRHEDGTFTCWDADQKLHVCRSDGFCPDGQFYGWMPIPPPPSRREWTTAGQRQTWDGL